MTSQTLALVDSRSAKTTSGPDFPAIEISEAHREPSRHGNSSPGNRFNQLRPRQKSFVKNQRERLRHVPNLAQTRADCKKDFRPLKLRVLMLREKVSATGYQKSSLTCPPCHRPRCTRSKAATSALNLEKKYRDLFIAFMN